MQFHIVHITEFDYPTPATEAFSELRLRPRDTPHQAVSHHQTRVSPAVLTDDYTDYFGNHVETMSIPFRHQRLTVTSVCDVFTQPRPDPLASLSLSVCEARLLNREQRRFLHDFSRPSRYVTFTPELREMAAELLPDTGDFTGCLLGLNRHIFENFAYTPGVTNVNTSVAGVLERRQGVCQDFAHVMIGVCRLAGIPARYVSGYIETDPAPEDALVGATASHAWVEVMAPNGFWVGLDPTNNILEGERHVQIGIGRDYYDVPPMKGTFKGPNRQVLSVDVRMTRGTSVELSEPEV
ncbi:MAG TPA: transglutaminase family protein [Verrucomicrobiales bacterium]|nr:transglutaminase family protein [Verrucomicrobiales bacterium]